MRGYARLTVCEGKQLRFGGGRLGLDQTSVQWEEGTCEGGVRGACEGRARGVSGVSHARLSGSKWTSDLVESGGDTRDIGPLSSRHVEASHARVTWQLLFMRIFPVFGIFLYFFCQNL